ncbi:MAG: hypothetical protein ACYDGN_05975 [Acidimicrobiales bacterium]
MAAELAELSSISSTLEQLVARLGAMAEDAKVTKQEDVAHDLFAVERSLSAAHRRLARMTERNR